MIPQHKILIVDDTPINVKLLTDLLEVKGYLTLQARNGEEALVQITTGHPDLVLLDVMMPGMTGYEVCRHIRGNPATALLPVVMITALNADDERISGIEAGADDFLAKPFNQAELIARVQSLLRIKTLQDKVKAQAVQLSEWAKTLQYEVKTQVKEIQRLDRLRRFFSPQVADLILEGGAADPLKSHRREITVLFIDLRGFTAFAEAHNPEKVMEVLREYHEHVGRLIVEYGATLERFTGDGMMIFFNDPVEIPDPTSRAVRMAVAMKARVAEICRDWAKRGYDLQFGIGGDVGEATIGAIGFEGRIDYGAIGTVTNTAARLCDAAKPGQILMPARLVEPLDGLVEAECVGELPLKGLSKALTVYNVLRLKA